MSLSARNVGIHSSCSSRSSRSGGSHTPDLGSQKPRLRCGCVMRSEAALFFRWKRGSAIFLDPIVDDTLSTWSDPRTRGYVRPMTRRDSSNSRRSHLYRRRQPHVPARRAALAVALFSPAARAELFPQRHVSRRAHLVPDSAGSPKQVDSYSNCDSDITSRHSISRQANQISKHTPQRIVIHSKHINAINPNQSKYKKAIRAIQKRYIKPTQSNVRTQLKAHQRRASNAEQATQCKPIKLRQLNTT